MSKNVVTLKSGSEFTQDHWKWYHSIYRVWFPISVLFFSNFVPKMHRFWDIRLQKCCDLENQVRDPPRSFEISQFDRAHTTSYWRSIVTMALSRVVSQIFSVEKCRDLEIGSNVTQGHWEWHYSIDCVWFPISVLFFSNFVPKMHRFLRYSTCKYTVTLKPGLAVTQGHQKLYHSIIWSFFECFLV